MNTASMTVSRYHPALPASGFTLLEILVALVIFSVGLLGIAKMQAAGLKTSQEGYLYTLATLKSQALGERLRTQAAPNSNNDSKWWEIDFATWANECDTDLNVTKSDNDIIVTCGKFDDPTVGLPSGRWEMRCEGFDGTQLTGGTTAQLQWGSACTISVRWDTNKDGILPERFTCSRAEDDTDTQNRQMECFRMVVVP